MNNPEDNWEDDETNDTEIMKNINSLLDSGKFWCKIFELEPYIPRFANCY